MGFFEAAKDGNYNDTWASVQATNNRHKVKSFPHLKWLNSAPVDPVYRGGAQDTCRCAILAFELQQKHLLWVCDVFFFSTDLSKALRCVFQGLYFAPLRKALPLFERSPEVAEIKAESVFPKATKREPFKRKNPQLFRNLKKVAKKRETFWWWSNLLFENKLRTNDCFPFSP